MATASTDVPTVEAKNATNDYYLLAPETDLDEEVLWQLPAKVTHAYPNENSDSGWEVELNVDPGTYYVLEVETATGEIAAAKGGSVVHPNPAGENSFSTAEVTTFTLLHGFLGGIDRVDGDVHFALDTACLSLEVGVGQQFTIDRRGE